MDRFWFQVSLSLCLIILMPLVWVFCLSCFWFFCPWLLSLLVACTKEGVGYTFKSSKDGIIFSLFKVDFSISSGNALSSCSVTPSSISQSIDAVLLSVRESQTSPHVISRFLNLSMIVIKGVLQQKVKVLLVVKCCLYLV